MLTVDATPKMPNYRKELAEFTDESQNWSKVRIGTCLFWVVRSSEVLPLTFHVERPAFHRLRENLSAIKGK